MKAYISYHFGTDISEIFRLLKSQDIDFFDSMSDVIIEKSFQESTFTAIKECDFVIVVYDQESGNLAFEAGIAIGLKKPLFAIISSPKKAFPDFLVDSVHVFAKPTDYPAIKFSFDIFINKMLPRTSKKRISIKPMKSESNEKGKNWLKTYDKIEHKNDITLDGFLEDILNYYQLRFMKNRRREAGFQADFSFWSERLNNVLGNPILLEVKNSLTARNIKYTWTQMQSMLEKTNSRSGIVLFANMLAGKEKLAEVRSHNVFFVSFPNLLARLKKMDLEDAILDCRNELIHKSF